MTCARGCVVYHHHQQTCRVEDGEGGAWAPVTLQGMIPGEVRETFFDADTHLLAPRWRAGVTITQYGGLEVWQRCTGCLPREARHGLLCETCHARLSNWLAPGAYWADANLTSQRLEAICSADHPARAVMARSVSVLTSGCLMQQEPMPGTLAGSWWWLAADTEPGQAGPGNDKIRTSRTPPAALNLTVYELRQGIAVWFSHWIAMTCIQFDLTGPSWWRQRVDVARRRRARGLEDPADWRAQLPHGRREIESGRRFLSAWLDRIEADPELALPMFDEAQDLMRQVQRLAPWEARPRNLRGIPCPECEREALALFEGSDFVECRRCEAIFEQDRYDIWSEIGEAERTAA